jgi:hypothetical protein
MAVIHKNLTGDEAIHPATYVQTGDPGAVGDDKLWIDKTTGTTLTTGWLLKLRGTSNSAWATILDLLTTLALKANLVSPTFTGTPAAPTAAYGTSTTQLATTAMVQAALATRVADGNTSATKTVDFSTANIRQETLNAATVTFTFTAPATGAVVILECSQDATGGRLVTWPATVHWSGGTAPTLSTGASKVDVFTFYWNGTTYFGVTSGLNYTA